MSLSSANLITYPFPTAGFLSHVSIKRFFILATSSVYIDLFYPAILSLSRAAILKLPYGVSTFLLTSERLIKSPSRVNCLSWLGICIYLFSSRLGCFPQYDTIILTFPFEVNSFIKKVSKKKASEETFFQFY